MYKDSRYEFIENFIQKFHEDDFEDYMKGITLDEMERNFDFFNSFFKDREVKILLEAANSYESMYRDKSSCSCLSHGELSYSPYFRTHKEDNKIYPRIAYLETYMYAIAVHNGMDFYYSQRSDGEIMRIESTKFAPSLYEIIDGLYKVDDNGVHITNKNQQSHA